MSIARVIESIEHEMLDRATKGNCGKCKWWADNEVCVNGYSEQVTDFTDRDFSCKFYERDGKNG